MCLELVDISLMLNYDKILQIFYIEIVDIMLKSKLWNILCLKLVDISLMLNYDKILQIFYTELVDIMLKSIDEIVYIEMGWYYSIVKL